MILDILRHCIMILPSDDEAKDRVRTAMGIWEENTCVKFRPAEKHDRNYIMFYDGEGYLLYIDPI